MSDMNDSPPNEPLFANLSDDDPDLLAAVSIARRTLPQFINALAKSRFASASFLVKVPGTYHCVIRDWP